MRNGLLRIVLFSLGSCASLSAMNPAAKSPQELLVGAAGAGNIKGLNYHIVTQKMSPNTFNSSGRSALSLAAGNGQLESVKYLLNARANPNIQDVSGLTPLHWAVLFLNRLKTEDDYLEVIRMLLSNGARLDILDNDGLSILHGAARAGNLALITLLLNSGAANFINHEGSQDKGRTPLAEALRAAKDAIIHVKLENQDISDQENFAPVLAEAIAELKKKEERKLSTDQIINVINLLKRYGAHTNSVDTLGHTLDYYLNEVQLISEPHRIALLNALNLPITARIIQYRVADLPQAINILQKLQTTLPSSTIAKKINLLIWTIQAAQRDPMNQYDILRIGMALTAKIRELAKTEMIDQNLVAYLDTSLNHIRTILRDSALIGSGKAEFTGAPIAPKPTQSAIAPAPQQTPAPAAAPAKPRRALPATPNIPPALPGRSLPSQAIPRVIRRPLPQPIKTVPVIAQDAILIREIVNFSKQPATFEETFVGGTTAGPIEVNPMTGNKPGIKIINHVLNSKYLVNMVSSSTQVLYEIPRDNPKIIQVFEGDNYLPSLPIDTYKTSRIIVHSNGAIRLMAINN
ncbi:hypothetical protein BH09DEP1_BH09DEP1_5070 [soil metagenome]